MQKRLDRPIKTVLKTPQKRRGGKKILNPLEMAAIDKNAL
jgi:hypothetical protein